MRVSRSLFFTVAALAAVSSTAWAQDPGTAPGAAPVTEPPAATAPATQPPASPQTGPTTTVPGETNGATTATELPADAQPSAQAAQKDPAILDGHVREGAFLSGPGSLTFILHHTLMGAAGGLATQGISTRFDLSLGSRERMLVGTLLGAGIGFGVSSWWQFNHWIGMPVATFGIVNSIIGGMAMVGLMNLFTENAEALAWTAFIGMELGAWLTTTLGGGDMPMNHGLFIASGGLWGLIYSTLFVATIGTVGAKMSPRHVVDTLFLASGLGAGGLALATLKYNPTSAQVLRADAFGLGVGAALFVISAAVVGFRFDLATPYLAAMLGSAGAITAVSLLWEEAAERPEDKALGSNFFYRSREKDRPYSNVWW